MADKKMQGLEGLEADKTNIYKEEIFSDLKAASIRKITPVKEDGTEDIDRKTIYSAHTQIMTQGGALPISAEVDAQSLGEAFDKFPKAISNEVERLRDEAQKQQIANAGKGMNLGNLSGQQGGNEGGIIT